MWIIIIYSVICVWRSFLLLNQWIASPLSAFVCRDLSSFLKMIVHVFTAHWLCVFTVQKALDGGVTPVIVDNTNVTMWEMFPYAAMVGCFCVFLAQLCFFLKRKHTVFVTNVSIVSVKMFDCEHVWLCKSLSVSRSDCACVCVSVSDCAYVCVCEHVCLHVSNSICVCEHVCVCVCLWACVCERDHVWLHMCLWACLSACV